MKGKTPLLSASIVESCRSWVIEKRRGLHLLEATGAGSAEAAFAKALKERKTAGTKMNTKSSRSHLILTIKLVGTRIVNNKTE